jgi:hypothetical protein
MDFFSFFFYCGSNHVLDLSPFNGRLGTGKPNIDIKGGLRGILKWVIC